MTDSPAGRKGIGSAVAVGKSVGSTTSMGVEVGVGGMEVEVDRGGVVGVRVASGVSGLAQEVKIKINPKVMVIMILENLRSMGIVSSFDEALLNVMVLVGDRIDHHEVFCAHLIGHV
jgi:hypothetical protein